MTGVDVSSIEVVGRQPWVGVALTLALIGAILLIVHSLLPVRTDANKLSRFTLVAGMLLVIVSGWSILFGMGAMRAEVAGAHTARIAAVEEHYDVTLLGAEDIDFPLDTNRTYDVKFYADDDVTPQYSGYLMNVGRNHVVLIVAEERDGRIVQIEWGTGEIL